MNAIDRKLDIDGGLIIQKLKPKPKKKKGSYTTYFNWQVKQLNAELERKLPNEFKGSIENFNHRSCGGVGHIDDNQYSYY